MHNIEKPKRIHLLGQGRHEEARAGEALMPGHLLAQNSVGQVIKHATSAGAAEGLFALEDALQGRTIATAYALDELVAMVICTPGDVVYAWLAAGETVTLDDTLTSNGDGTLKVGATTDVRLAIPLEALDNSDTDAVDARIKVRIL